MKRTGNSKIAVVGWGRGMGHKGHMYLADAVITQAINMKADPYFFVSKTVGKDDPVFPEEKVRIYQKVFPQFANIFEPQGNLNQALTDLAKLGYQGVVVVVGADQKKAFQYLEGNNKEGVPVYQSLGLKKLRVISRQETNSKYANEEGPRATPMREILLDPNATEEDKFKVWRRDMPDELGDREVLDIMNKAESRLVHDAAPKVLASMSKKQTKLKESVDFTKKANDVATLIYTVKPAIFKRFGDEYVMDRIEQCVKQCQSGDVPAQIATEVVRSLVQELKEANTQPQDDDSIGYMKYFAKPTEPAKPQEKRFHSWDEYETDKNAQKQPEPELEEARIIDRNAKINAYYISSQGKKHKVAEGIPYYLLDRLVQGLTKKYNITMNDIEVRPADVSQYRTTNQPELVEFAPGNSGNGGNYLKALASAWYNGTFNTGDLHKGIKSQEDVERILARGIHCGDGKVRKYSIGYNANFDGVEIQSDDHYEYSDYDDAGNDIDSRTGKPWGPYDVIAFSGKDLNESLNEFAPDEGGGSRKFIPWPEFIEQVKQIVSKDFDCVENVVKTTIKARFVPHDPMEYGPTMLYSYYETRAGGRNKGAVSTRGSIQIGKYTGGGFTGQIKDKLLTTFSLLKGHPFERHFDLTFDNIYKIANIIMGNTQGALEFKPEQQVNEFAPSDDGDSGQEDMFFKYAKLWYNGNLQVQQRIEETLAQAGWEIGEIESEEGGAFIVQSGDEDGKTYMGWSAEDLGGLNEGFDREEFRRHMKDLEAREELRKTDPVAAKALDLRGQLPQQSKKKPEDDSIGTNDPRHPGYAYTQAGQHNVDEAGITRRGILKGIAGATAAGAAGKASAIAGAFPTPSHQAAMYKAAADSNAAQARADAAEKARRDAQRLKQGTSDIERLNKINFHGGKVTPINATWDGDSDFMDVDGTKYSMASRMPIKGDEPGNMKLVSTKEGRQVYMWTRNSLKGVVGRYFYPAPEGSSQINEFAPGNGDDGLPYAEYQVYQCNPLDQFDWIGGPLYQTDNMGMAHKYAYEMYVKHRPKAFMVWQERSQGSRGNYGVKGESDSDLSEDYVDEK